MLDDRIELARLVPPSELEELIAGVARALGCAVAVFDLDGNRLAGSAVAGSPARDLEYHGEPVARLAASGNGADAALTLMIDTLGLLIHHAHARDLAAATHEEAMRLTFAELTEHNQRLQRAVARLEELDRLKSNFLATMSHELRTPLTSVIGYAEMMAEGLAGPVSTDQREYLTTILGKADQLLGLITSVLEVSSLESGQLTLERSSLSLAELVASEIATFQPQANRRGIAIQVAIEAAVTVIGDRRKIRQVVTSLLSNAVKFTPDRGRVEIDAAVEGDALVIRTKDGGVGIAPEFLPYVFDRFRQADSRSTRRHGGLGLGLAIAQHLVTLHGGRIRAESDGLGRGASLVVELPVGAHVTATPMPAARRPRSQPLNLAGTTAVVVDDAADSRELLCAVLQNAAATVVACESAASALTAIGAHDVGLVVADIAMPDVDGYELIRQIRTIRKDLPAIAVSAFAHPEDRARAIAAGYSAYCAKPLDTAAFLNVVRDALGERAI